MADASNHEQGLVIILETEESAVQTGVTTIRHLYVTRICVGRRQGVL